MVENNNIFLIDTNIFIEPYRKFYAFDLIPTYWERLKIEFKKERIVVLDMVYNEIEKGEDALSLWLINNKELINVKNHKKQEIIYYYGEVLRYLQTSGLYTNKAVNEWSRVDIADPWLIATAKVYNYTIVTNESKNGNLSLKQKSNSPKIPDVCYSFGVNCIDLYEMMRQIGIKI